MADKSENVLIFNNADETGTRHFHVTGIAERWRPTETEEKGDIFTKDKFEKALKKVTRKTKK